MLTYNSAHPKWNGSVPENKDDACVGTSRLVIKVNGGRGMGMVGDGGSQRGASGYSEKRMNSDGGPSYKVCQGGGGDNARTTTAGGARRSTNEDNNLCTTCVSVIEAECSENEPMLGAQNETGSNGGRALCFRLSLGGGGGFLFRDLLRDGKVL